MTNIHSRLTPTQKNLTEAYDLLSTHTGKAPNKGNNKKTNITDCDRGSSKDSDPPNVGAGVLYLQEELVEGRDSWTVHHITYYSCGKKGHDSDNCPSKETAHQQQHVQTSSGSKVIDRKQEPISSEWRINICSWGGDDATNNNLVIIHFQWAQVANVL